MNDEEQAPARPGHEPGPSRADDAGPVGGPYAFAPRGGEPGLGSPGVYPGIDPAAPAAGRDPSSNRGRTRSRRSTLPLLLIGAAVLLGLLAWLLVALVSGPEDEARVDPSSVAAGECLADFTDITEDAVLVECTEAHNAQLVATEEYPEDADFPGRDQLGVRAEAACATASEDIEPDVLTEDLEVTLLRATPTAATWADGDRRVDCFAVVGNGATMTRSLLAP